MSSPRSSSAALKGTAPADVRLPEAAHVGGVRLQVSDLARSRAYYRDVLGLREMGEPTPDTVVFGAADGATPLVTLHAVPGTTPAHRRGTFGLFHFAILLPDRAALGRFLAHLAARGERAGMSDHLVSEALYLADPDGLGIEVYADRPRDTWQYADGQLAMATDPLDAHAVMAAGGGTPWTGMPAGTAMGHVHLHVGDLEVADTFYRRALGLDLTTWSYPGALFFSAGGYHHHLGTNTWAPGPAPAATQAQLVEWTLVVPTAAHAVAIGARMAAAGAPVATQGADAVVSDPWGTRVRITAA
ncbi:MAG: VOC family protein [Acidobacteria bacterium]|nr:VOC family protein [Acidobacteriota bacterium]